LIALKVNVYLGPVIKRCQQLTITVTQWLLCLINGDFALDSGGAFVICCLSRVGCSLRFFSNCSMDLCE